MSRFFVRAAQTVAALLLALCVFFTTLPTLQSFAAPAWPQDVLIEAEGGILVDASSGCVLYGKNIHERYYPASITKILTALIVIERCNLDDTITFSYDAVHNVENGSTSAGYGVGDRITVREALYALLLRSANEVANALAEHCAGSREAFAALMNEKAASLGCKESHFTNPSGLNDENHYTTAYDYSLIAMAAFKNPTFLEFDSTTYYELPPNSANAEPFTIYAGHKMLKKSSGLYYPGIIGGKTGYTMTAGNTLVTCAERDNLRLITVVLNGHLTHYSDTKKLLDFGFSNFKAVSPEGSDNRYEKPQTDLDLVGRHNTLLSLSGGKTIVLPRTAQLSDTTSTLSYELPADAPADAVAQIRYLYGDRTVGSVWLCAAAPESNNQVSTSSNAKALRRLRYRITSLPRRLIAAIAAGVLIFLLLLFFLHRRRKRQRAAELAFSRSMNRVAEREAFNAPKELSNGPSSVERYLGDSSLSRRGRRKGFFSRFFSRRR